MIRSSSAALALLFCSFPPPAWAAPPRDEAPHERQFAFERPCMGTLFRVVVATSRPRADARRAADAAFAIAEDLDAKLSDYRADSEVNRFNQSPAGEPFVASKDLLDILALSEELQRESAGGFDPSRGALTWLWRLARRTGELPAPGRLAEARAASGLENIEIAPKRGTIARRSPLTRLDFGGIAKGFAADRMLAHLRENGFRRASVAAGGDLALGDAPPGKEGWPVTIAPTGTADGIKTKTLLSNVGVSTSGKIEQAVEIDGQHYSHIIDPSTGLGLLSSRAATAIAPSATESDALATALCVLGPSGVERITRREGVEAAVFPNAAGSDKIVASSGFPTSR